MRICVCVYLCTAELEFWEPHKCAGYCDGLNKCLRQASCGFGGLCGEGESAVAFVIVGLALCIINNKLSYSVQRVIVLAM